MAGGYKVLSVTDPTWANPEHTVLTCMALFAEMQERGPCPFSVSEDADTDHGAEVWYRAMHGEYGEIAPYDEETHLKQAPNGATPKWVTLPPPAPRGRYPRDE